jgi:hypothetical protein
MVQIQGIKIGMTMVALVVALFTVNTLTAATGVGVELSGNDNSVDDVKGLAGEFQSPEASGAGSQDPGFFGVAVGVTKTIQQLVTLTVGTGGMLKSWGIPGVIATSIQIMIDVTMGIGILQIIGRWKF